VYVVEVRLKILVSRVQVSFLASKMKPLAAKASGGFLMPQNPVSAIRGVSIGCKFTPTLDIFRRVWTIYWGKVGVNQSALIPSPARQWRNKLAVSLCLRL
ncbi:MAG: hypothetical protein AAGM40_30985, partial [Cyanobacteria bacterium J06573_2]